MKKFIAIIAIVMTFVVAANAQADALSDLTRYVLDTTPVPVTVTQAQRCAEAYHNGGTYRLMNEKITLTCTKHTIREEWDPSQN